MYKRINNLEELKLLPPYTHLYDKEKREIGIKRYNTLFVYASQMYNFGQPFHCSYINKFLKEKEIYYLDLDR